MRSASLDVASGKLVIVTVKAVTQSILVAEIGKSRFKLKELGQPEPVTPSSQIWRRRSRHES